MNGKAWNECSIRIANSLVGIELNFSNWANFSPQSLIFNTEYSKWNSFQKIFDIDFIFTIVKIWTQFIYSRTYKVCINLDWCQCFATITLARWKSSLYYLSLPLCVCLPFNILSTNWLLLCCERNYVSIFIIKHRNNDNCVIHTNKQQRRKKHTVIIEPQLFTVCWW